MALDLFWSEVVLPLSAGTGLSILFERFLQPGMSPVWKRPWATHCIHVGLLLLVFTFALLLLRRPWFAIAIVLALVLLIVQVSNAKYHSLREPFVVQDFEYFTDALKYPRLYLPFLGVGRAIIVALGFGAAFYAGLTLETSLTESLSPANFFSDVGILSVFGFALLFLGARKKLVVIFEPETDLRKLGLMASLWRYGEEERAVFSVPEKYRLVESPRSVIPALPNLVVVQSESFFDVRRLFSGVRTDVLREFDDLKASAICQGQMEVSAWGANTVRTEFAFLSGLEAESLGVHRFNPYRKLARQGIPNLAGYLKRLGYRTVCVHPYVAGFYARDKVFPLLGFDEFIDIRSFKDADRTGPYIGDMAVAEKIGELLQMDSDQPVFVFVITMENHGPLHLEKVLKGDVENLYLRSPPPGCEDLTIYLRHLRNADRMAGMLQERLSALPGQAWLCWYGDHVPIMPEVYRSLGEPDGKTDYLICDKDGHRKVDNRRDLKVECLSHVLLHEMGLDVALFANNHNTGK